MGKKTASGTIFSIGTKASDPTADTYTVIGEVETQNGDVGRSYNQYTFKGLASRAVEKFKGSYDDGNLVLVVGVDEDDAGQGAVLAALDDDDDYNFRIEDNDAGSGTGAHGTYTYFKGKVISAPGQYGDGEQVKKRTLTIGIKSGSLDEVAAV